MARIGDSGGDDSVPVTWPAGLVAFWDFSEDAPPYRSRAGTGDLDLRNGPGADVRTVEEGPFGHAASFDGQTDHLIIPFDEVGPLDLGGRSGCTVVAWLYRETPKVGFIAGRWNEDDAEPHRQFGLFVDMAGYGGESRVIGHVSRTGGATPGYPFSRDYSAGLRGLLPGAWRFTGFSYDGRQIVSYLDAIADSRPVYIDGEGHAYPKNPYPFEDGLNSTSRSDFTVGANRVGHKLGDAHHREGIGLFFHGRLGGLAVFDRALTQDEFMALNLATCADDTIVDLDFYRADGSSVEAPSLFGWRTARGRDAVDTSEDALSGNFVVSKYLGNGFLLRTASGIPENAETPAVCYFPDLEGLSTSEVGAVSFTLNNSHAADSVRLCIRIAGEWFATTQQFANDGDGRNGSDWRHAESKTVVLSDSEWVALGFVPGERLELDSATVPKLPPGEITGVGFSSAGLSSRDSVVRIGPTRLRRSEPTQST